MGRGGIGLGTTKIRSRREDAPPVYTYEAVPGMPLVSTMRLGRGFPGVRPGAHSRDFLVLNYFERGASSLLLGDQEWQIEAGDAYVIAPGEVADASGLKRPKDGASTYLPTSSGSEHPAPSSPGAPTCCSSPSSGVWPEVPSA